MSLVNGHEEKKIRSGRMRSMTANENTKTGSVGSVSSYTNALMQ
jgi:hypothetical protein